MTCTHPVGTVVDMTSDHRTDQVDERGVLITAEGRRRARAKMDAVANRDPAERERGLREFRARLDALGAPAE